MARGEKKFRFQIPVTRSGGGRPPTTELINVEMTESRPRRVEITGVKMSPPRVRRVPLHEVRAAVKELVERERRQKR